MALDTLIPIKLNLSQIRKLAYCEPDSCYNLLWPLSLLPTSQSKLSEFRPKGNSLIEENHRALEIPDCSVFRVISGSDYMKGLCPSGSRMGSQALSLWKDQALSSLKNAASGPHSEYVVNMASSSFRLLPGKSEMHKVDVYKSLPRQCFLRYFHATVGLLARTGREFGMRTSKKDKYVKRDNRTQPPVEAPYLPPKVTRSSKLLPDCTIEIFEGMTILELSKRTGKPISTLQDVLINVGEKVGSEFDPHGIDIAELVAMVCPFFSILRANFSTKEAGGITQHLGAFVVNMPSGASIDTPGHAAFSAMRPRGAAVTDIVVLVVAAVDGVMPQTIEAMSHAKVANVPIVVAINKCDKPGANPERVKLQLASEGLMLEEMGGDVEVVQVSAIQKTGLDDLEEALLLQSELMELKARVDGPAQAYVVEARLDKGRGALATAIVKAGTLLCGQHVVVGAEWAIRDTLGKSTDKARPAMPVEIEGLKGLPMAGDDVVVVESEERARMLSAGRKKNMEKDRIIRIAEERIETVDPSEDAQNSRNANLCKRGCARNSSSGDQCIENFKQSTGLCACSSCWSWSLAQACGACIVGFSVSLVNSVSLAASRASVQIKLHRVICRLLEDIGNSIVDKAPGTSETQVADEAQLLNIFELKGRSKSKGENVKIAGCRVTDGKVIRSASVRLLRSGEVVFEGCCESLKQEKNDVEMVGKGRECGVVIRD
ncbi:Translation initiation factor IF-2-like protein [Drosera capensis]